MPRRGTIVKHQAVADPIYGSVLVSELISKLMLDGKRSVAESIFYEAAKIIQAKTGKEPLDVFESAVKNVMPVLEVRARRVGGATYQVPTEVRPERRKALAYRWIVGNARRRPERTMAERFASEIIDASENTGTSVKRKEEMHKMAEANKAFAHYRW
ncbi:MAG: 30S ribosomal protein S7 [Firmicutes bacterium]|jgi:small subunit ribosomal protein S7|nr:30S ribosomal protein S7 [Bacillota bacterium]MDD4336353.1 30S ribosomal protein S7 [Bacillota bacterium]MDD4791577.1 30S ribosomal protein S7 [Bacillota bacterium]